MNLDGNLWWCLLHHGHHCILPCLFIHTSLCHPSSNPYALYFVPPHIRHLQGPFVRRFFSCSCRLKPRWKVTLLTLDLNFVSCSRFVKKLLNLTATHAANPAATLKLNWILFYLQLHWKVITLPSLPHTLPAQAAYCIDWLTGWLHRSLFNVLVSSALMHVTLEHHELTSNAEIDGWHHKGSLFTPDPVHPTFALTSGC